MWPNSDKIPPSQRPKSARMKELERHYREHLATLPPERVKLFEIDDKPPWNGKLGHDLVKTVEDFKAEMANNPAIEQALPGVSAKPEYAFISVHLKPGLEPQAFGLPEFYRGYWVAQS